jgi:hypothetical protein
MLVSDYTAAVAAAKAAADEGARPFAGTGPDSPANPGRPDGGERVRGDPLFALRQALEQLRESGRLDEARSLLQQFLGASEGPPEGDQVSAGKSLLDPRMKSRLREALAGLQVGPRNLEAARAAIRKDKEVLRFVDATVRRPSPERRSH